MTLKEFCTKCDVSVSAKMRDGIKLDRFFVLVPAELIEIPIKQVADFLEELNKVQLSLMLPSEIFNMENPQTDALNTSGVYFLIKGRNVMYIGSSNNIQSRIRQHKDNYHHDSVKYILTQDYKALESKYIFTFNIHGQHVNNTNKKWLYDIVFKHIDLSFYTRDEYTLTPKNENYHGNRNS